jgi:uncharacterized protein (DUF58 family)
MIIRPAISAPLPWLTVFAGRFFGKAPSAPPAPPTEKRQFLKLPRTLSFTKEGWRLVVLVLLIGIAAINTGNNLLYLVVAMLLSLIVISGIMSESTLRKVHVKRNLPRHVFRGVSAPARLKIENTKRFFSSYSFNVKEAKTDGVGGVEAEPFYTLKLGASKTTHGVSRYTFSRRGVFKLKALELTTRFPFGLFVKGRKVEAPEEVVVYPRIRPLKHDEATAGISPSASSVSRKGTGTQLHALRDYTLWDDSRFIYWKSAARTRKLLTKEFEEEKERKFLILFENYPDSSAEGGKEAERGESPIFEQMVEKAASLAAHFIKNDFPTGLKTLTTEVPVRAGKEHLYRILRTLALTAPREAEGAKGAKGGPSVSVIGL